MKKRFAVTVDYLDRAIVLYMILRYGRMTRSELTHRCRQQKGLTSQRVDRAITDLCEMGILSLED